MEKALIGWGLSPFFPGKKEDIYLLLKIAFERAFFRAKVYPEEIDLLLLPDACEAIGKVGRSKVFYRENSLVALERALSRDEEVITVVAFSCDSELPSMEEEEETAAFVIEKMKERGLFNPYSLLGERKHYKKMLEAGDRPEIPIVSGAAVLIIGKREIAPALNPDFIEIKKWHGEEFEFLEADDFYGEWLLKVLQEMKFSRKEVIERLLQENFPFKLNPSGGVSGWGWLGRCYGIERVAFLAEIMEKGSKALVASSFNGKAEIYLKKS